MHRSQGKNYTVEDVDNWHRARGFNCQGIHIGYHYLIYLDGSIHKGRPEEMVGAHCQNHNKHSIGVCYVGGLDVNKKPKDTRTPAQRSSLFTLLSSLKKKYPRALIVGHRDLSPDLNHDGKITKNEYIKDCPCFDAITEYKALQPQ